MKRIGIVSLLVMWASFSSCDKEPYSDFPSTGKITRAMFVNAAANVDSFKVKINDTFQTSIPTIIFLNNSGYKNIRAGNIKATVYFPYTDSVFSTIAPTLNPFSFYSFFLMDNNANSELLVSQDDVTAPSTNKVKIRFANMSSDTASMDCYVASEKLHSMMSHKIISDFKEIDAVNNVTISMITSFDTVKVALSNQNLSSGKIYTLMLSGKKNGTGNATLKLTTILNN